MNRVLVHQGPHPVHARFAEAAGLAFHRWLPDGREFRTVLQRDLREARRIPAADVMVAEGGAPAGSVALCRLVGRADRAVVLAADETWARLARSVLAPLPTMERVWWRALGRALDGAIAVSPYVARDLAALFPRLPVRVVRPFVLSALRARLLKLSPTHRGARLVHLAKPAGNNGTRIVLDAFAAIRAARPDAELALVGTGAAAWAGVPPPPGVRVLGAVPDLAPVLAEADLLLLPGLGQACPVVTLEAMTAGVPALVSTETGTADLVAEAAPALVTPPEAARVADAALAHLALGAEARRARGEASRAAVAGLTEAAQSEAFRVALADLAG